MSALVALGGICVLMWALDRWDAHRSTRDIDADATWTAFYDGAWRVK